MIVKNKCLVAQIIIYLLFILLQIRFNDIAEQMRNRISGVMVADLDFYSASSRKQQSADRYVAPLGHIILTLSQPVFALTP
jgi:hypothetical protein